jgi:hypothetical protein
MSQAIKSPETFQFGRRPFAPGTPESIILRYNRPALLVQNNTFSLGDVENAALRDRLEQARQQIEKRIPAVGRIELEGYPCRGWGPVGS